jgi:hypothetical protein
MIFTLLGFSVLLLFQESNVSRLIYSFAIVFIPGGLFDFQSGIVNEYLGRKEFWFYASFIIIFFVFRYLTDHPILEGAIIGLVSIFVILIHELFSVFILILFTVLFLIKKDPLNKENSIGAALFYGPVLIATYFAVKHHGNADISNGILQSYANKFPNLELGEGNIQLIAWSVQRSHEAVLAVIQEGSIIYYMFFAITSILFILLFVILKFRRKFHLAVALIIFSANLFISLLVFYFFWDVGRLISIFSLITILSLILAGERLVQLENTQKVRFESSEKTSEAFVIATLVGVILIYLSGLSLVTRVEHCCSQPPIIPLFGIFGLS